MDLLYIVDDEEDMLQTLEFYFTKAGYEVQTFTKSKEMMEALETRKPDLILMDVNLRRNDGRTMCKVIKRKYDNKTPIILFSGNADLETEYKSFNADGFISKPFSLEEITKVVEAHLQN
jgi:DNA-binding response OmpR family regulator